MPQNPIFCTLTILWSIVVKVVIVDVLVVFTFVVNWSIRAHLVTSKWVNQLFTSFVLKLVQIRWCVLLLVGSP